MNASESLSSFQISLGSEPGFTFSAETILGSIDNDEVSSCAMAPCRRAAAEALGQIAGQKRRGSSGEGERGPVTSSMPQRKQAGKLTARIAPVVPAAAEAGLGCSRCRHSRGGCSKCRPVPALPTLGCTKCRHSPTGCARCRAWAAAAVAEPEHTELQGEGSEEEGGGTVALDSELEDADAADAGADGGGRGEGSIETNSKPERGAEEEVEEEEGEQQGEEEEALPSPTLQEKPSKKQRTELGCSKCRHSLSGCKACRGRAAQAGGATSAGTSALGLAPAPPSAAEERPRARRLSSSPGASPPSPASVGQDAAAAQQAQQAAPPRDEHWWDPTDAAKVRQAKAALHVSAAAQGEVPLCRERQAAAIDAWLERHISGVTGGSLYLSGLPGTGKTLTALELVRRCGRHAGAAGSRCALPPALLAINCMRLTEPRQVVARILSGYKAACRRPAGRDPLVCAAADDGESGGGRRASSGSCSPGEALDQLQQLALAPLPAAGSARQRPSAGGERGMIVVVLDELDSLLAGRHGDSLVEDLFSQAHADRSRLLLVGIANSIDLVDRLMRPGGSLHRRNLRPAHEVFPAYLRHQVCSLLCQRLAALPGPVLDPSALEFCARKVANGNGDMRRALEACAQAVDIVAGEHAQHVQQQSAAGGAAAPAPKRTVGMRQMAAALSRVTGGIGVTNDNVTAIRALPVPQQLLMCAVGKMLGDTMGSRGIPISLPPTGGRAHAHAAARFIGGGGGAIVNPPIASVAVGGSGMGGMQRRRPGGAAAASDSSGLRRSREVTLGELEASHVALCKAVGVAAYSSGEFATAADVLCTLGLVEVSGGAGERKRQRVSLRVPEDDVVMALAEVPVLKDVVGA